jgi:DNA (cytosine-5)-methyltransferase 1
MIKVGSDFSGVGAFNQALIRLGVDYEEVFACDMDKYARQTFIHNYGHPIYYPTNVYDRSIPIRPLDIYMTSPPCQAFSLAGKRLGKDDKRGVLFFNSHEFIKENNPRYFIFENVKGLLSDDNGNTFNEWVNMLGGKSVNGLPVMFPYEDSVPYHLYWKVLNAKNYGVPQNRERVFLIGIRDDKDNTFRWPVEERLNKRLKDVLESDVDDKYYLSENMVEWITQHRNKSESQNTFPMDENDVGSCVTARYFKMGAEDHYIQVKSATSKGYEEATEGDSINFSVPNSETRRGRVGKQVAQTLDTACNQGVICGAIRARGDDNQQQLELNSSDYTNSITTVQKDNVVIQLNQSKESGGQQPYQQNRVYDSNGLCPAISAGQQTWGGNAVTLPNNYQIRRLTPRECFRLMDFPDSFTWPVSDSQAYKQAGNSIVVNVLYNILKKLNL